MTNFLTNIGISKSSAGDISLLLSMLLAGVMLMFIVKKTKIGAFAFAAYAAYFITEAINFDFVDTYITKTIIFLVIALSLHYALFKPAVVVKLGGGNIARWIKRIIIAFSIVGFMVSIILSWMPNKDVVDLLSPFGLKIFTTELAKLIWAIAPLVTLFIVRKRE
jgi:hypothetical protein